MTEAQKALLERIKAELSSEDERTWQEFVDHQELGQCQVIAATIAANPRSATGVNVPPPGATAHPSAGLSLKKIEISRDEPSTST